MIDTVTVYRRGARVRRAVPIEPGASELKLAGLPLALDDGSVRLRVEGRGVRAVDVRVGVEVPPFDAALLPPRDEELFASEKTVALLRVEVERLGLALGRLDALHIAPRPRPKRGAPPGAIPADARTGLARLRSKEAERIGAELGARKAELRTAERAYAELRDRDQRASNARNAHAHELRKSALVRLDGRAEPGAKLYFEYLVPGACWSPAYTVWVDEGERARVAMRAQVAQRSGEDWRGAKLVLSTADPDEWTELPELTKIRIGRAQPPKPKRGWREAPEGARELYADYDQAFGVPAPPMAPGFLPVMPEPEDVTTQMLRHIQDGPVDLGALDSRSSPGSLRQPSAAPPMQAYAGPMSSAQPQPLAHAPELAKRRSVGLLGAIGAVVAAPAGLAMDALARSAPPARKGAGGPPPPPSPPGAAPMFYAALEQAAGSAAPEPRAAAFSVDVETLSYGRLRMFGPSSEQRGELAVVTLAALYAEGLPVDGVSASIDVATAIHIALERAEGGVDELPPGHVLPDTPDAFDYAYAADIPADIPSDGAFHVVPVVSYEVPAVMRHVAVPREASDVFRLLDIECPDAALLAGPADIYEKRRGEHGYLMTTRVSPTPPRAKLALGLGVEQAIKISRNTTFAEQKTGLLGGGLALVHQLEIEVKNNLSRAASIEVRERIPTKRQDDDDVEIALGPATPAWEEWDQDDSLEGGRRWNVELGAGEATTLEASYTVRIAGKHQLVGGNRRES